MSNWQKVDETAPQLVRDVAEGWKPRPGQSRFEVFYDRDKRLYCICTGPSTAKTDVYWLELPYID